VTGRAASPAATADGGNRRLGLALLVIATAQLMVVLDATIVNVALPHVQRALGFSGTGLEWVVNAYAVTFGGLLLLGGRAGDIFGRRRVFVFGLLLFSVASLLGGFATSQWWLLTARAIQGVGGAVIAPTALALITTNFPEGGERNRAFSVYAAMAGAGSAMGLLLGGILTTYASLRSPLSGSAARNWPVPCPSRKRRHRSPRHRSPGLCSGMRTEPPSPRRPVLAGSASRHVITTWEKSAGTTPAPRPTTAQRPRRHHAVLRAHLPRLPARARRPPHANCIGQDNPAVRLARV